MKKQISLWFAVCALALLGANLWIWLHDSASTPPSGLAVPHDAGQVAAPSTAASRMALELAIKYPVLPSASPSASEPAPDIQSSLIDRFGRQSVLALFQLDDFASRFAATVDSLGREHAPVSKWPLNPVAGRFLVEHHGDDTVIGSDNGLRYTEHVLLLESVDSKLLASTYMRFYPQFQQAYEEQGFPGRNFNDRVVEVIDQLLVTPVPQGPVKVLLPVISGVQPGRPWVLYRFEDPRLRSLTSGQKILLRVGPVNERRIKVKLAEVRRYLTVGAAPR